MPETTAMKTWFCVLTFCCGIGAGSIPTYDTRVSAGENVDVFAPDGNVADGGPAVLGDAQHGVDEVHAIHIVGITDDLVVILGA